MYLRIVTLQRPQGGRIEGSHIAGKIVFEEEPVFTRFRSGNLAGACFHRHRDRVHVKKGSGIFQT